MRYLILVLGFLITASAAHAQPRQVVPVCGTQTLVAGDGVNGFIDQQGRECTAASAAAPTARTIVTLSVKTVTTGGTAVTAIAVGGRTAGGWIQNPPSATVNLCLNEISTAVGSTSSGDTYCIVPGQSTVLTPSALAVSVISSDSAHPFAGYSLQ